MNTVSRQDDRGARQHRVAVRAWATPATNTRGARTANPAAPGPRPSVRHALVIDTETTTDETQALLFGAYRYLLREDSAFGTRWVCAGEGLIYGDDLPERDPTGFALLQAYATSRQADVDLRTLGPAEPDWRLHLLSRRQFTTDWLWHVGYPHNRRTEPAMLVFFNAPFDLSRLAVDVADARRDMYLDSSPGLAVSWRRKVT